MIALLAMVAGLFFIYVFAFTLKYFGWILKVVLIYGLTVLSVVLVAKALGETRPLESFRNFFIRHIPEKQKTTIIKYMPKEENAQ